MCKELNEFESNVASLSDNTFKAADREDLTNEVVKKVMEIISKKKVKGLVSKGLQKTEIDFDKFPQEDLRDIVIGAVFSYLDTMYVPLKKEQKEFMDIIKRNMAF